MLTYSSFFDISEFSYADLFTNTEVVWDALHGLKAYMNNAQYQNLTNLFPKNGEPLRSTIVLWEDQALAGDEVKIEFGDAPKGKLVVTRDGEQLVGATVLMAGSSYIGEQFYFGKGVLVESGATVMAPTIVDDQTVIRQGAYIRGYCLFGKRCVVGHVTEVKHSVFLNDAKAGHFAYLGDSILGNDANLGAGTKFANLKFTAGNVQVRTTTELIDSGLRKFGAVLGDKVQTGCNSVTNPGTVIGPKSMLLPNTTSPSGYHKNSSIIRG